MASRSTADSARLTALAAYHILDTPTEQDYDDITLLASLLCNVPICVISLLDDSRQWFKSCVGVMTRENPISLSFCAYAIQKPDSTMIVPDALEDPRFVNNPQVTGEPYVRFYAGVPLVTPEGHALGTLCVIDRMPRTLTEAQQRGLEALARQVVCLLEMRLQVRQKQAMEHLFLSALDVMQEGFLLIDREGEIAYSNTRVEEILHLTKSQLIEKRESAGIWRACWHEDSGKSSEFTLSELRKALTLPRTGSLLEVQSAGQESAWLWVNSCPIPLWDSLSSCCGAIGSYSVVVTLRDVTAQKRAEASLAEAHAWTNSILSSITDAFLVLDRQWKVISVNKEAERLMGRSEAHLIGKNLWKEYPEAVGTDWYRQYRRAMTRNEAVAFEAYNPANQTWNDVRAYPSAQGIAVYFRDITSRKNAEKALQESEARLEEAQQLAHLGSFEYCIATDQIYWSKGVFQIFERDPKLGHPTYAEAVSFFHPEDYQQLLKAREEALLLKQPYEHDLRIRQKEGAYRWIHIRSQHFFDAQGELQGIRGTLLDIHERKQAEQRIQEANERLSALASIDGLTGLKNHRTFQEKLSQEFLRSRRYSHPLALLLLDVDYFKQFNDRFGHPAGDSVLREVGAKLQSQCRATDLVARYGGEEFAIVLPETDSQGAFELAERIRTVVEQGPWAERAVTVSIGITVLQPATLDEAALIREADKALYQAKALGRNCVAFSPDIADTRANLV